MMNGFPNHENGNYQYYNNNVQSQMYQPNTQSLNHDTIYYNNNQNIQHQNVIPNPATKNTVYGSLPYTDASVYSYDQNLYPGQSTEIPSTVPIPLDYQSQMHVTHPNSITTNHVNHNALPSVPLISTRQPAYLPQLQPQITHYPKPSFNTQSPAMLVDQMKNIQLSSSSQEQTIDLMQTRNLFDEISKMPSIPKTCFPTNCDTNIMQCTLNTLPIESNMLSKCRLPLGVHIQPFRDMDITLVQTNTIVRCRSCRTYINPFVTLTDHQRRWHCNVCGRVNDIPDEFLYDSVTKTYGSPTKRPELLQSNIEYSANPDYTVRPPMATIYVFCFDVSHAAIMSGYLRHTCDLLIENLHKMPGDSRKQIAFLAYNSSLHFYQIRENSFRSIMWPDLSEVDLPVSEDLLVSIDERKESILEFLRNLPLMFPSTVDHGNCLGYALQVAMKLISHNGGRITVVNASLPNVGPGSLKARDSKESDTKLLQPTTDLYKSLALQCANDQITVDLFCINRLYSDIASYSSICRHTSGGFYHYGNFRALMHDNQRLESIEQLDFDRFTKDFTRYITRKIGFEAVMRTRCSRGLELTAFHGNLFMRSTNVIALPVVNPDASYSIQFKICGNLTEWSYVIIQSALLYTTSESDRRIRVHTICLPLTDKLDQVFHNSNAPAIAALIVKIAIDKCISDGLHNVREAFVNSLVDPLKVFNTVLNQTRGSKALLCPYSLRQLAPLIAGLLRNPGFRATSAAGVDDRVAMLESLRSLPLTDTLRRIYPCLVPVHALVDGDDVAVVGLSGANVAREGAFLMDVGHCLYLMVGSSVSPGFVKDCLGYDSVCHLPATALVTRLDQDTELCRRVSAIHRTLAKRSLGTSIIIAGPDDGALRSRFLAHLLDDRADLAVSYYEFLKTVQSSVSGH